MRKHRGLWRTLLLALMGVLIGVGVYNWNARSLTGDQMPMPLGFGVGVVLSGSMEPTLQVNDLVVVCRTDDLAVGDVVVFQRDQELIIHRILTLDGETLITQGDANDTPDEPIGRAAVKGVLVCAIPGLGAAVELLRDPTAIVVILIGAFALMELSYRKEKDRDRLELEEIQAQIRSLADEMKQDQN